MLTDERQQRIRTQLADKGRVLAAELAAEFGVSEDTVRRDLRELAGAGFCRRVYGGALLPAPDLGSIVRRQSEAVSDKALLARAVAGLIEDGQTLFIDAGSTNLAIAQALPQGLAVTVITNAPAVALALDGRGCKTLLLGGLFNPEKGACLGSRTLRDIQNVHADLMILGACGVDHLAGVTALDPEEAEIKRGMIEQSGGLLIAATDDKLGTVAPFKITAAAEIDHLVVTASAAGDIVAGFAGLDIAIHRAA